MEVTKPHGIELERFDETISKIEGLLRRLKQARAATTNRPQHVLKRPSQDIPAIPRSRTGTGDLHGSGSISDADDLHASPEPTSDAGVSNAIEACWFHQPVSQTLGGSQHLPP